MTDAALPDTDTGADPKDPCAVDRALEPWNVADDDERWEKLTEDGGLMKLKLRDADEEDAPKPEKGEKVECHYTGTLRDGGDQFDSSRERGDTFKFDIGNGAVIKGWDEGIATMQIGEKAILRCRSDYAYGDNGSPPKIPGGATLDFVVEMVDIKSFEDIWDIDDAPNTISKKEIKKPDGWEKASERATVIVTMTAKENDKNGRVFLEVKEEELKIPYDMEFDGKGICAEFKYPRGFYSCLKNCGKGSIAQFKLQATDAYTWGSKACEEYNLAPNTDIFLEIELVKMDNPESVWSLDKDQKVPFAVNLKAEAGGYFKKKKLALAKKLYDDVIDALKNTGELSDEDKKQADEVKTACHSNIALIEVQLGNYGDAMKAIDEGLKLDSGHVKLRYRKAQVHFKRSNFDDALQVLEKLLQDAPDNKGAVALQAKCKAGAKAAAKKQRKLAKKMFKGFGAAKKAKKAEAKESDVAAVEKEAAEAVQNEA